MRKLTNMQYQMETAARELAAVEREIDSVVMCAGWVRSPGPKCVLNREQLIDQLLSAIDRLKTVSS